MTESDALLLGRKTWQGHGGAFDPMPEGDPFGDVMNTIPKYVVSTTLISTSAWRNSTLIKSNVVEEVRTMKAQPGKNIAIEYSQSAVRPPGQIPPPDGRPTMLGWMAWIQWTPGGITHDTQALRSCPSGICASTF
jgi:hypothetical protein